MANNVAIRLGTTGKGEVKSDFAEIGATGTQAMKGIADGARQAGDVGEQQARRLAAAYERATADMEAADRRRAAAAQKLAVASSQTDIQARINSAVGTGFGDPTGTAKQSALVFAQLLQQEEQMEARARALMAAIDPLWAAQQRYNAEIAEARELMAAGAISADLFAKAELRAKEALDAATVAQVRNTQSAGANRAAMANLSFQVQDAFTQIAMGANAFQVVAVQGGQAVGAFAGAEGAAGSFARFMLGPWGLAITAGMLAIGPLMKALDETEQDMKAVTLASSGLGDAQGVLGQMFDLTTGKIKSQNDMLRLNAQLMAINLRAAAAAKEASSRQAFEAAASGQPAMFDFSNGLLQGGQLEIQNRRNARTLQNWVQQYRAGTLSGSDFARLIETLPNHGLKVGTTEMLQALSDDATARTSRETADKIEQSLSTGRLDPAFQRSDTKKPPRPKSDEHAETLARESEATESLIANLEKLASAYDVSDAAALKAQITARAMEQGIRKQADLTEYVDQQMRKAVAEKTAQTAATVAGMSAENTARRELNRQVLDGTVSSEQANQMLRDEAQIRPLLAYLVNAQGKAYEDLAAKIAALREQMRQAHENDKDEIAGRYLEDMRDRLEIADEELRLIGASNSERDRSIQKLQLMQDLGRRGIEIESERGQQILQMNDALQARLEMVKRESVAWDELRSTGENFVDTVFNPNNWTSWGDLGKRVLQDLEAEFIKLALANPLKNFLFGEENPTIGGVFGQLGKIGGGGLFGGGSGGGGNNIVAGDEWWRFIGRGLGGIGFASGTENFSGGMALVGEAGPELAQFPAGTRINNAASTRRLMAANNNSPIFNIDNSIYAPGADAAALAQVQANQERMAKEFQSKVIDVMRDAFVRRVFR